MTQHPPNEFQKICRISFAEELLKDSLKNYLMKFWNGEISEWLLGIFRKISETVVGDISEKILEDIAEETIGAFPVWVRGSLLGGTFWTNFWRISSRDSFRNLEELVKESLEELCAQFQEKLQGEPLQDSWRNTWLCAWSIISVNSNRNCRKISWRNLWRNF